MLASVPRGARAYQAHRRVPKIVPSGVSLPASGLRTLAASGLYTSRWAEDSQWAVTRLSTSRWAAASRWAEGTQWQSEVPGLPPSPADGLKVKHVILLPTFPILGAGDSDSQATRELEEKVVSEKLSSFFSLTRGLAQVSRVEAYGAGDKPLAVRASVKPSPRAPLLPATGTAPG